MAGTSQPKTKRGNIILRRVSTPSLVAPGQGYEVEVKVSNGAAFINTWDPDSCGTTTPGYKIRVVLTGPNGEQRTKGPMCIHAATLGTGDETFTFTLQAPSSGGEQEVQAHVEMVNSGKRTDSALSSFLVDADDPEQADQPGDSDSADNGDDSGFPAYGDADGDGTPNFLDDAPHDPSIPAGGGGPLNPLDGTAKKAMLLIGLLALAWFASSASNTVEAVT